VESGNLRELKLISKLFQRAIAGQEYFPTRSMSLRACTITGNGVENLRVGENVCPILSRLWIEVHEILQHRIGDPL